MEGLGAYDLGAYDLGTYDLGTYYLGTYYLDMDYYVADCLDFKILRSHQTSEMIWVRSIEIHSFCE